MTKKRNTYWTICPTITNGSCSYHAFAEVFIRICRNQPQYLNPGMFDTNNPLFQNFRDFLKITLNLGNQALTLESLQEIINRADNKHDAGFVLEKIAPGLLILILDHYRKVVAPLKARYQHHFSEIERNNPAGLNFGARMDRAFHQSLEETDYPPNPFIPEAHALLQRSYLDDLFTLISGADNQQIQIIETLANHYTFIRQFIASPESPISELVATRFVSQIRQGFIPSEYADEGLLLTLMRLLLLPSNYHLDAHGRNESRSVTYPCAIASQQQIVSDTEIQSADQPYVIYNTTTHNIGHFEYGLAPVMREQYHESPSTFRVTARTISCDQAAPSVKNPISAHDFQIYINQLRNKKAAKPGCISAAQTSEISFSWFDVESLMALSAFLAYLLLIKTIFYYWVIFTIALISRMMNFISQYRLLFGAAGLGLSLGKAIIMMIERDYFLPFEARPQAAPPQEPLVAAAPAIQNRPEGDLPQQDRIATTVLSEPSTAIVQQAVIEENTESRPIRKRANSI